MVSVKHMTLCVEDVGLRRRESDIASLVLIERRISSPDVAASWSDGGDRGRVKVTPVKRRVARSNKRPHIDTPSIS